MSIDERFIKTLHVESLREPDLRPEDKPHVVFQTSTIWRRIEGRS